MAWSCTVSAAGFGRVSNWIVPPLSLCLVFVRFSSIAAGLLPSSCQPFPNQARLIFPRAYCRVGVCGHVTVTCMVLFICILAHCIHVHTPTKFICMYSPPHTYIIMYIHTHTFSYTGGLLDYPPPPDWGRYVDQSNNTEVHFARVSEAVNLARSIGVLCIGPRICIGFCSVYFCVVVNNCLFVVQAPQGLGAQ